MKIAELVIRYRIKREYDPEKGYYCFPVLEEAKLWVHPRYAKRRVVNELEWDVHTDNSTTFSRTESVTDVMLDNGEWVSVKSLEYMNIYSNAAPLGARLVETCPTGVVEYRAELNTIDDAESIAYLNEEYGDIEDIDEPVTIEVYLEEFIYDWMRDDEYLHELRNDIYASF